MLYRSSVLSDCPLRSKDSLLLPQRSPWQSLFGSSMHLQLPYSLRISSSFINSATAGFFPIRLTKHTCLADRLGAKVAPCAKLHRQQLIRNKPFRLCSCLASFTLVRSAGNSLLSFGGYQKRSARRIWYPNASLALAKLDRLAVGISQTLDRLSIRFCLRRRVCALCKLLFQSFGNSMPRGGWLSAAPWRRVSL